MSGFLTALAAVFNALFLVAGVYIYISLLRQISARTASAEFANRDEQKTFGLPEAVLGAALATFFALNAAAATSQAGKMVLRTQDLIANAMISVGLFLFIAAFLKLRKISVNSLAGFSKLGFWRTLVTGGILLFAAYPLIFLADLATRRFFGGDSSRQGIVELFNDSQTIGQRVLIIVLAVIIANLVALVLIQRWTGLT